MEIYILAALSFAVMFSFRYIRDIIFTVKNVAKTHGVGQKDNTLYAVSLWLGILSMLLFPAYLIYVLLESRKKLIMDHARLILLKCYDVELKISS